MDTLPLSIDAAECEGGKEPVKCLGQEFESDQARRAHYLDLLAEKLKDPEFRKTPGFPKGTDEAILRMSDPPYYTACPNPFLQEFVKRHGRPYDPSEEYHREPFAVDVRVGKRDPLYKAHSYHTKVPHLAIVPSILHYTRPGDIVLDGFCGSGMTGVAAQWCGSPLSTYRMKLESEWHTRGRKPPEWGERRVILGDLSPAATFIAANYNLPFDIDNFSIASQRVLDAMNDEIGWMYETRHEKENQLGSIIYTVWSEVFACPNCSNEVVFFRAAVKDNRILSRFPCPSCDVMLSKKTNLERMYVTEVDTADDSIWKHIKFIPVQICYSYSGDVYHKMPSQSDLKLLDRISEINFPEHMPISLIPIDQMYHGSRLGPKGFWKIHQLFTPRARHVLSSLWRKADSENDPRIRNAVLFLVEQSIGGLSILNRHHVVGRANVNQWLNGVYYIPSVHEETSIRRNIVQKRLRMIQAFSNSYQSESDALVTTGDCACMEIPSNSVDYIFTDPPFGENIFYSDLNLLVESWHRVFTDARPEAIVDKMKRKDASDYQNLMFRCFLEYHRVLKFGRWMTVVFSNSSNAVWRAIQEAMGLAGFVVADVRTLDKQQGSFRQVTSSAVKQDLVISAYKPTESLEENFKLGLAAVEDVWNFVSEHLGNVPIFANLTDDQADVIAERTSQMLHDRMIAFFVQRRVAVPVSAPDFFKDLDERYPARDGMYFLPDQISQYDRKRTTVNELRQLNLFVQDEASATQWVRQLLQSKPQTFQDLQPQFMQQLQAWAKHEKTVELKEILNLNFLCYDGDGPVPSQIHSYLSTNFKSLRNLDKDDGMLKSKALDRWYVPDPGKDSDLQKLRTRAMLREFDEYRSATQQRIRQFRTEAVRVGFKHCYDEQDYRTIVDVARKLPAQVIQEDEKLLMYYDVATMRLGDTEED